MLARPSAFLLAAALTVAFVLPSPPDARAELVTADVPTFVYRDHTLVVRFVAHEEGVGRAKWRALTQTGKFRGVRQKKIRFQKGTNTVSLPVGGSPAHWVELKVGERRFQIGANRGVWFVGPKHLKIDVVEQELGFNTNLTASRDVVVARGLKATMNRGDGVSPMEVGRTIGRGDEFGVPLAGVEGLVLVVGASAGALRVTLTEQSKKGRARYWDYWLDVKSDFRRYVIPIELFRPRTGRKRPRKIFAVTLQAGEPSVRGNGLDVDLIGFVRKAPRLEGTRLRRGKISVSLEDKKTLPSNPRLFIDDAEAGEPAVIPFSRQGVASVAEGTGERYWMCYLEEVGTEVCDPPDAPHTTYSLPRKAGTEVTVDDFETRAPVNRFRRPHRVFASSVLARRRALAFRRQGHLFFRFEPKEPGEYAGFRTSLPRLPKGLETVELLVRGRGAAKSVRVGLRDVNGYEPKIRLSSYLSSLSEQDWDRVLIPLEAFRGATTGFKGGPLKIGSPVAITVTIDGEPGTEYRFELDSVRFLSRRSRLVVANFDGDPPGQTALGGVIRGSTDRGAKLTVARSDAGLTGQGLEARVERGGGSALVAVGLGRVNVSKYENLSFAVRGAKGGERLNVYLSDGRRRGRVDVTEHLSRGVTDEWQQVAIPLRLFNAKINRRRLQQITFAWEDPSIDQQTMYFDDLAFE